MGAEYEKAKIRSREVLKSILFFPAMLSGSGFFAGIVEVFPGPDFPVFPIRPALVWSGEIRFAEFAGLVGEGHFSSIARFRRCGRGSLAETREESWSSALTRW